MSSVLRPVRKRKKSRKLGPVDVIRREDYGDLELDAKVELIRSLVPLGLMHVEEMLDDEVTALAGARYARKDASIGGRRHGSNPGTVGLAGQRVPIRVPRIRRVAGGEIPLRSYAALHGEGAVNDRLLTRVLYGISCRNYAAAAEAIPGAIGLSGSTVSRTFIQASAACQWQTKTAHFWQLKTAHVGEIHLRRSGRSSVDVRRAFWAGRRERSDRSPGQHAPRSCAAGGHVATPSRCCSDAARSQC